jgi:hypothetical protein
MFLLSAIFLIAFLNSPYYETPKNAIKKNRAKQPREEKHGGKKDQVLRDEPRWTLKDFFPPCF